MQIKGKYSWAKHLDFMVIDLGALLLSFFLAYYSKFHTFVMGTEWKRFIVIVSLLNVVIALIVNPYSGFFRRRYYREIGRGFLIVAANALSAMLIFYVLKIGAEYSREVVIYTYVFYYLSALVLKYIWKKLLTSGIITVHNTKGRSLFLISYSDDAEKDIHSIYSTELPLYDIKGIHLITKAETPPRFITYKTETGTIEVPVIQSDVVDYILAHNIGEVLVSVPLQDVDRAIYERLIANGVNVDMVIEPLIGFRTEEQFVTTVGINKALSIGTFSFSPAQSSYLFIKRAFDILCSLIGIILLIPITALVKLINLLAGDTKSIFYRQKRVGMNGKTIRIWKFRSMIPNADEVLKEMLKEEKYRKEWEENQKFENDPRITKVGNILRKTSIDELPQLLNVFIGDMSLVGDRVILGQTRKKPVFMRLSVA